MPVGSSAICRYDGTYVRAAGTCMACERQSWRELLLDLKRARLWSGYETIANCVLLDARDFRIIWRM
jgi:hypothetical protein